MRMVNLLQSSSGELRLGDESLEVDSVWPASCVSDRDEMMMIASSSNGSTEHVKMQVRLFCKKSRAKPYHSSI